MAREHTPLPQYEDLAKRLSVRLCDKTCILRDLQRHRAGWADYGRIHFAPRSPTKRGIWTFLKLVVEQRGGLFDRREVERIWMRNTDAYWLACDLGFRFPREWADLDRAKVRAILAANGDKLALDANTRRSLERWARPASSATTDISQRAG